MPTILITDDDTNYRANVLELVELWGYNVVSAANGEEALAQIEQQRPDLILCDLDMPVMDGLEVLKCVKGNPATASIPFVLVTGRTDDETKKRAIALLVDAYITKPMNIDALQRLVADLLASSQGEK